ncbi:hypothetical protein [uncultured Nonlabens sp.]|nr:hypothetical protein [uncultured Nonlabens sp.]
MTKKYDKNLTGHINYQMQCTRRLRATYFRVGDISRVARKIENYSTTSHR